MLQLERVGVGSLESGSKPVSSQFVLEIGLIARANRYTGLPSMPWIYVGYNTPRMKLVLFCLVSAVTAMAAVKETKMKLPNSGADFVSGELLFQNHCALCHGLKGGGGRGPMLTQTKLSRAPDDATLLKVIEDGIRGTEMPGADSMSEREMKQTAAYVRSLGRLPQKPVPGNPARGRRFTVAKATVPPAIRSKAKEESRGRTLRGSAGDAAPAICANR
jgi:mono/diheme cytochrome c family protein